MPTTSCLRLAAGAEREVSLLQRTDQPDYFRATKSSRLSKSHAFSPQRFGFRRGRRKISGIVASSPRRQKSRVAIQVGTTMPDVSTGQRAVGWNDMKSTRSFHRKKALAQELWSE